MKHMGMVKGFSFPVTQRIVGEEEPEPAKRRKAGG